MSDCRINADMDWTNEPNYPRPDFLSSSRKRLAPQLMFKGGILNAWKKKMAVALDVAFFETLPALEKVSKEDADMSWLIYDLIDREGQSYELQKIETVYTKFSDALDTITRPKVGKIEDFIKILQSKVDEKLENPPENKTIDSPFGK